MCCRRCNLLFHLSEDTTTIHDILSFLKDILKRFYLIFLQFLLAIILTRNDPHDTFIWNVINMVLIAMNVLSLQWVLRRPFVPSATVCLASSCFLSSFCLASLIRVQCQHPTPRVIVQFVAVLMIVSTTYILYHLRGKLISANKWDMESTKEDFFTNDSSMGSHDGHVPLMYESYDNIVPMAVY